jgi:hypothetical protein
MNGKTTSQSAASRGTVPLGGELTVNRLGFGAMRITGEGIWGPPKDRAGAIAANAARKGEIPRSSSGNAAQPVAAEVETL